MLSLCLCVCFVFLWLTATGEGQHIPWSFSKRAVNNCSKFSNEKKERGERCVLCVSQPGVELSWGYNGSTIRQGEENCVEFQLSDRTGGIYLCTKKGTDELLLVHIVTIKEKGGWL